MKLNNLKDYRRRRHLRVRNKIVGTAARPRMALCVSNTNLYIQFVDDAAGKTLASASSLGLQAKLNVETAKKVGELAAEAAKKAGISLVVVDRGGFQYHGRIKAAVEAALQNGLKVNDKPFVPAEETKAEAPAEKPAKKPAKKAEKKAEKPAKEAK